MDHVSDRRPSPATIELADDMGRAMESMGLPAIAGRLLGWLVVCDPAEQSAAELADALHASAGSISTNIRLLERHGLVEQVRTPAVRRRHYRLRADAWVSRMHAQLVDLRRWQALADRGLAQLADAPEDSRARLREMSDFFAVMHDELDAATRRYRATRADGTR